MNLLNLFRSRNTAPVARERLQLLLAYERDMKSGQPDLVAKLRDDILKAIAKHVKIDHDDVSISMERGERVSTLEIDIQIPNQAALAA